MTTKPECYTFDSGLVEGLVTREKILSLIQELGFCKTCRYRVPCSLELMEQW